MASGIDGVDAVTNTGAAVELLDNLEGNAAAVSVFGVALLAMRCTVYTASCSPGEVMCGSAASPSYVSI